MVKILIYIKKANNVKGTDLMQLKKVLNLSLTEVKNKLVDNSRLIEYPMFYNDHDEVTDKVFRIINVLKKSEMEYSVHEVPEGMGFLKDEDLDGWIVDEDSLDDFLNF